MKPEGAFCRRGMNLLKSWRSFWQLIFLAGVQTSVSEQLKWLEVALLHAQQVNDPASRSAYPAIYSAMIKCYQELNESEQVRKLETLIHSWDHHPQDSGPFFHGTRADLKDGDLLVAGGKSNYQADLKMNHIYFTALINGAGLAASLAKGDSPERVYVIVPTGSFEHDPNVTDKKFPGNMTRSYRSESPLRIIGEITEWNKQTEEDIQQWKARLKNQQGEIIN